jgi:hypothetical protein
MYMAMQGLDPVPCHAHMQPGLEFLQPVWPVSRVWQPLLVAALSALLYMPAFASLCKPTPASYYTTDMPIMHAVMQYLPPCSRGLVALLMV